MSAADLKKVQDEIRRKGPPFTVEELKLLYPPGPPKPKDDPPAVVYVVPVLIMAAIVYVILHFIIKYW